MNDNQTQNTKNAATSALVIELKAPFWTAFKIALGISAASVISIAIGLGLVFTGLVLYVLVVL